MVFIVIAALIVGALLLALALGAAAGNQSQEQGDDPALL
jgi:hypothetical protein